MASKDKALRALSDSHLRAIGKVAANWSSLETEILNALAELTKLHYKTTVILAGGQNILAWCEMLKAISGDTGKKHNKTALDGLCIDIAAAHAQRNEIVHCSWDVPFIVEPGFGLFGAKFLPPPTAREQAKGTGIKRKTTNPIKPLAFSATQMLSVARQIAALERRLHAWEREWRKAHPPEPLPVRHPGLLAPAQT